MKQLKAQIQNKKMESSKTKTLDGKPTNKSTSKTMIFQEMKQLKAQIQNKKMENLQKPQPWMENQATINQ